MNGKVMLAFVIPLDGTPLDPGFGQGRPPVDPGYGQGGWGGRPDNSLPGYGHPDHGLPGYGHPDHGLPGHGHPGNALPIPPVRPSPPIVLPPGMWPPSLPPGANVPDNTLPGGRPDRPSPPIVIPPDPSVGIEQPIFLPSLPPGVALLIALPNAQPKQDTPPNTKPAILVVSGQKPVLVYVSAAPAPK